MSDRQASADDIDVNLLQPVLRSCVEAIGLPATLRLVETYGGLPLYVPLNPKPSHPLAELIGFEQLQALGRLFGAEAITIPKAEAALRAVRDRRLREARRHSSVRQLAIEHRLTARRVKQILAEGCGQLDADQADLFG